MNRITDERLAEIFLEWVIPVDFRDESDDVIDELMQALKAEREKVEELEAREPLCRCADEVRCDYLKRIEELEAELKLADEGLDFWQKRCAAMEKVE